MRWKKKNSRWLCVEICEKMVNNYDRRTYKNIKRGERMKIIDKLNEVLNER